MSPAVTGSTSPNFVIDKLAEGTGVFVGVGGIGVFVGGTGVLVGVGGTGVLVGVGVCGTGVLVGVGVGGTLAGFHPTLPPRISIQAAPWQLTPATGETFFQLTVPWMNDPGLPELIV